MSDLRCVVGRHDWGPWALRPPRIGARTEWLYWASACRRTFATDGPHRRPCPGVRRRWFKVTIPTWSTLPDGIKRSIPVEAYLKRIGARAPDPVFLRDGDAPEELRRAAEDRLLSR